LPGAGTVHHIKQGDGPCPSPLAEIRKLLVLLSVDFTGPALCGAKTFSPRQQIVLSLPGLAGPLSTSRPAAGRFASCARRNGSADCPTLTRFCAIYSCNRQEFGTECPSAFCTQGVGMEELNGRMIACQILVTGLIARVANDSKDPLRYLTDFRDEILAVVRGVRIGGALDTDRIRQTAVQTIDELFSLMKRPSDNE
jgi:hypothetical protein